MVAGGWDRRDQRWTVTCPDGYRNIFKSSPGRSYISCLPLCMLLHGMMIAFFKSPSGQTLLSFSPTQQYQSCGPTQGTKLNPLLHQKQWGRDSHGTKEGDHRTASLSHTVLWLHPSPSEPVPSLLLILLLFVFCFVSELRTKREALQSVQSQSHGLHPSLGGSKQAPCSFKKVIKSIRSSPTHKTIKNAWVSSIEDIAMIC